MPYLAYMGWGGRRNYMEQIYLLYISTNVDGSFKDWRLVSEDTSVTGDSILSLNVSLALLPKTTLVYVDDLRKVKAFLYDGIVKDHTLAIDYSKNIEFRDWTCFTNEDEFNVMMDWQKQFATDKFPYLTPSQYSRKHIAKTQAGAATALMPDTVSALDTIYKAVHPGVLYCRDTEPAEDMLGLDISSAYIYSLVFKKHACTAPIKSNPNDWELYIGAEDKASIGYYKITYKCIFSIIHCFKDIDSKPLQKGRHTAEIMLSNVDLQLLMSIPQFEIYDIECVLLYTFKMDYLPADIRKFCIEQYLIKQGFIKDTPEYNRQKVILNSIYGNLLYDAGKILSAADPRRELHLRSKRASVCPQWGIFTMAYTKQAVIMFGIKSVGYKYSDTDSVYCAADTANRKLLARFNQSVMSENYALCDQLGYLDYDMDVLCKLGTFKVDAEIKRFRAWGYKTYAYETIDGKLIVKAAGCNKSEAETDPEVVFSEKFKPKKGTCKNVRFGPDWYVESDTYAYLLNALIK